jgi:DNA-binding Lrp family transcriptional regulator
MFLIYNHTHACLIDEIDLMVVEQDRKEALLQAMANGYMRKILLSTVSCARPIEEIARENGIPISTCYRRVRELIALRLLRIEKTIITDTGKKYETFRSLVKDATVSFSNCGELSVNVTMVPREPEERLTSLWKAVRGNELQVVIA